MTSAPSCRKARFGQVKAEEKTSETVIQEIFDELPLP
jgi:hypothetical protein